MAVVDLRDKDTILAFLRRDPQLHLYSIGDLDDFFWQYTRWFGLEIGGELAAVFLIYTGTDLPVLLALEETDKAASQRLLTELVGHLPDRFYCHLTPGLSETLARTHRLEPHGLHHKMKLAGFKAPAAPSTYQCRILGSEDLAAIKTLYSAAYPDNWFDTRMLETGMYMGLFGRDCLIAIAGVHVYSKTYGVAALGNITTKPEHRGHGLGETVTAELCTHLRRTVQSIGLNVKADNAAAIRCYEKLGFEFHAAYEEHMAYRLPA